MSQCLDLHCHGVDIRNTAGKTTQYNQGETAVFLPAIPRIVAFGANSAVMDANLGCDFVACNPTLERFLFYQERNGLSASRVSVGFCFRLYAARRYSRLSYTMGPAVTKRVVIVREEVCNQATLLYRTGLRISTFSTLPMRMYQRGGTSSVLLC